MPATLTDDAVEIAGPELTAFEPSAARARFLDARMRRELAGSLQHILEQAGGQLHVDATAMQAFLARLGREPVAPLTFSYYCDAVLAIEEDDLDAAARLLREMIRLPAPAGDLQIADLPDPARDEAARRIVRFVDSDPTIKIEVFPPARDVSENCARIIREALALMDAGDPAQAGETRALLRQIILGAGSRDPRAITFDGASSFMLWGAIIINADQRDSALAMTQMLVHEASHNLLFGLCAHEALVENADDELYTSPLRKDPRPMDGIYHATFVSARMHRVVRRLFDSGTLTGDLEQRAAHELDVNKRLFYNGLGTVQEHGRLTPLGKDVMQGAIDYMATQ